MKDTESIITDHFCFTQEILSSEQHRSEEQHERGECHQLYQ